MLQLMGGWIAHRGERLWVHYKQNGPTSHEAWVYLAEGNHKETLSYRPSSPLSLTSLIKMATKS